MAIEKQSVKKAIGNVVGKTAGDAATKPAANTTGAGDQIKNTKIETNYDKIKEAAESSDDSDAFKYVAAVDIARNSLGQGSGYTDDELKSAIDSEYKKLGGQTDARQFRNENILTDMIGGMKGGIDGFNSLVGNGMDWMFDNTVGNAVGLVNKDEGENVKNFFTGEDLAVIPDMVTDIGLAAIPGAGIPLVAAKNLIQQSDNIGEAVMGRDSITGEQIGEGQRAAKAATGLGTAALASIPGVGKLGNLIRGAEKAGAKGMSSTAKAALKQTPKDIAAGAKSYASGVKEAGRYAGDAMSGDKKKPAEALRSIFRGITGETPTPAIHRIPTTEGEKAAYARGLDLFEDRLAKDVAKGSELLEAGRGKKAANIASNLVKSSVPRLGGIGAAGGMMTLADMAETGMNPADASFDMLHNVLNDGDYGRILALAAPLGAGRAASKVPGIKGAHQRMNPSTLPLSGARSAAAANMVGGDMEDMQGEGNTEEEILRRLMLLGPNR